MNLPQEDTRAQAVAKNSSTALAGGGEVHKSWKPNDICSSLLFSEAIHTHTHTHTQPHLSLGYLNENYWTQCFFINILKVLTGIRMGCFKDICTPSLLTLMLFSGSVPPTIYLAPPLPQQTCIRFFTEQTSQTDHSAIFGWITVLLANSCTGGL